LATRAKAVRQLPEEPVNAVRAFSRFYTKTLGLLRDGLLSSPYSLTEARIIFELANRGSMEVAELRSLLDIDAGYLSRILARFEKSGLATQERSKADGRRQVIQLTRRGRAAFKLLDTRSTEQVRTLLSRLGDEQQRRLVGAMKSIEEIFEPSPGPEPYILHQPGPGDLGWVVQRHGELYAQEYGWDESFEALVARIVADYVDDRDPRRENAWIAELGGEPVGCVFCVKKDETTAQLRLLLVDPRVRGMGIGSRLVEECIRFARRAGYEQMMLWTNDVLHAARRIYERAGFTLVEEERHRSFGHDLVGQNWSLALRDH